MSNNVINILKRIVLLAGVASIFFVKDSWVLTLTAIIIALLQNYQIKNSTDKSLLEYNVPRSLKVTLNIVFYSVLALIIYKTYKTYF